MDERHVKARKNGFIQYPAMKLNDIGSESEANYKLFVEKFHLIREMLCKAGEEQGALMVRQSQSRTMDKKESSDGSPQSLSIQIAFSALRCAMHHHKINHC